MMTPSGFALSAGTRLPDAWVRSGETKDAGNRVVTPQKFRTFGTPGHHAEKAYAVTTSIGGVDATMVGAGVEWTEDLKDQARRLHEDEVKYARQRAALNNERAEAKMKQFKEHIDRRVASYKANPVTNPDPMHTKEKGKNLW